VKGILVAKLGDVAPLTVPNIFADMSESTALTKGSSLELLAEEEDSSPPHTARVQSDTIFSHDYLKRVASERGTRRRQLGPTCSIDRSQSRESPPGSPGSAACATSVLILVFHAGSCLDASSDLTAKKSDVTTFRGAMESVARQHYPSLVGHIVIKLVLCPPVCTDALGILSSLSPYSFDASPSQIDFPNLTDIPIGAIPLLTTCTQDFVDSVNRTVGTANQIYADFLKSEDGKGFSGQVVAIGDSIGSILAHDALCRSVNRHGSEGSGLDHMEFDHHNDLDANRLLMAPSPRRRSSSTSENRLPKLDFEVGDFFMFGSPLSVVLASRRLMDTKLGAIRPQCGQVYNLFHPTDPIAARLEPLISARFSMLSPVNIPRYAKFPLGNGQPYHLLELIQTSPHMFSDIPGPRRLSDSSIQSNISGLIDNVPLTTINALQHRWWGSKRLDFALYCPEGLSNFPAHALPHLFHASYWESSDVIAFILRQIGRFDMNALAGDDDGKGTQSFKPGQPREKWNKKRTSVKLKNVAANHRANDVIVKEGEQQKLMARFMYGPLDMITLAGEKVDIHVMKDPPAGEWTMLSTEISDKNGRIMYTIPDCKSVGYGIYPIKMVVRGDHTSVDFYLTVVPPRTEAVVFSIDGSFTASMSVTGRDPKVRAGAVDVCRHWQELGYLLIYITGRPDMQQQRVVSWLSQHNFPHGLVSFADGLSTDPLGHKAAYLNNLIQNHGLIVHACYGSSKDISVYTSIGLKAKQIFIVGKVIGFAHLIAVRDDDVIARLQVAKKLQTLATPLVEGYAAHLNSLMAIGGSRPAQGNQRMVIPRGCFNLPGQTPAMRRRRSVVVRKLGRFSCMS